VDEIATLVRASRGYTTPGDDELLLGEDPFFDVPGAANFAHVSKYTISSWLWKKLLRRYKAGHKTLIKKSDLIQFIVADGKSPAPKRKAAAATQDAPLEDTAEDVCRKSATLPEPDKPAAPEAPPRRLYLRQKSTPAKAG
jgi:hypothetical protein